MPAMPICRVLPTGQGVTGDPGRSICRSGPIFVARHGQWRVSAWSVDEHTSEQAPHDGTGGRCASNFTKSSRLEHCHGPGVERRASHSGRFETHHVDGVPFDDSRTVFASKIDGGSQEGRTDTGSPVMVIDDEARHPPHSGVVICEHPGESLVRRDSRKRTSGSDSCPPDRMTVDIGDETWRYRSTDDLLVQRFAVVRRGSGRR